MRRIFVILYLTLFEISPIIAEENAAESCGFKNFQSSALRKDSPRGLRDEKGKWISDTRGMNAIGNCRENQWGALSVQYICAQTGKLVHEVVIPQVRASFSDQAENVTSIDISKSDYNWLVEHGWINDKDSWGVEGVSFYVQCK